MPDLFDTLTAQDKQLADDYLKSIEDLFKDPTHWTQGSWARDANSNPTPWYSGNACSFCLGGALKNKFAALEGRIAELTRQSDVQAQRVRSYATWALKRAAGVIDVVDLYVFNDDRDYQAVMNLLDKARKELATWPAN